MSDLPKFLRRQEVAATLRLSTRQVDRLIEEGRLERVKTSARRSTITSASLEAYLAERTGTAVPTAEPYASPHGILVITFGGTYQPGVAEAIDRHLARRFPGLIVSEQNGCEVMINWARLTLPYTADQIKRELVKLSDGTVTLPAA